jgi:Tol biopolymer transport system component
MKKLVLIGLSLIATCVLAQTGSEIYLADLKIGKTGVTVSNPKNFTNRVGYDNQPNFHPYRPIIFFSSFNAEGLSDIKTFNYKTSNTKLFTETIEREYSPTVTPDNKYISCIIQRDDQAQNLGLFPLAGGAPRVIINYLTVGYHAWLTQTKLVLFVLGEPNTLRIYDLTTKKDSVVTQSIGRALHKIPSKNAISFVDKSETPWKIKSFDGNTIQTICEALPNREDLAWTPDGKIIMSDGRQFFYYDTKSNAGWKMFFASELDGITRIAVGSNGKKIAFVVAEK